MKCSKNRVYHLSSWHLVGTRSFNPPHRLGRGPVIVILILGIRKLRCREADKHAEIPKHGNRWHRDPLHSFDPIHLTPASQKSLFLPFVPSLRELCRSAVDSSHSPVSKSVHNVQVIHWRKRSFLWCPVKQYFKI